MWNVQKLKLIGFFQVLIYLYRRDYITIRNIRSFYLKMNECIHLEILKITSLPVDKWRLCFTKLCEDESFVRNYVKKCCHFEYKSLISTLNRGILIERCVPKEIWSLLSCFQIGHNDSLLTMDFQFINILCVYFNNNTHHKRLEDTTSILMELTKCLQIGNNSNRYSTPCIMEEYNKELLTLQSCASCYDENKRTCDSQVIELLSKKSCKHVNREGIRFMICSYIASGIDSALFSEPGSMEMHSSIQTTIQILQDYMHLPNFEFLYKPNKKLGLITHCEEAVLCHRKHTSDIHRLLFKCTLNCFNERHTSIIQISIFNHRASVNCAKKLEILQRLLEYGKYTISSSICLTNIFDSMFGTLNVQGLRLTSTILTDYSYLKSPYMTHTSSSRNETCEHTESPEPITKPRQETTTETMSDSIRIFISKPKVNDTVRDFFCEKYLKLSGKINQSYSDIEVLKYINEINGCKKDNTYQNSFDIERNMVVLPVFRPSLEESFKSLLNGCNPKATPIMKYEIHRLNSFLEFSSDNAPSRIRLASNGWFSTGNGEETKCFSCGATYLNWKRDSDPVQIHESLSPRCLMVTGKDSENVAFAMQKTRCEETQDRNPSMREENSAANHCATKERFPTGNGNSPTCEQVNTTKHRVSVSTQNSTLCNRNIESEKRNSSATRKEDINVTMNNYTPSTVGQGFTVVNGNIADSRKTDSIIQSQNNPGSGDLSRVSEDQLSISNPFENNVEMTSSNNEKCPDFHRNSLGPHNFPTPLPFSSNVLTPNFNHTRQQNQNISSSVSKEKCPANVNNKSQEIPVNQNRSWQTTTFNQTKYEGSNMLKGDPDSGQNGDKRQTQLHPNFLSSHQHLCANLNVENGPQNTVNRPVNPSIPKEVLLYTLPPVKREAPRYPQYAVMTVRISSYKGWPSYLTQSERDLAMAGFYYRGYSDEVTCYQCGVTLANWQEDDDGCVEHARWRPECYYIRTYKGDEFVKLIQAALKQLQQTRNVESQQLCEQQPIQAPQPRTKATSHIRQNVLDTISDMGFPVEDVQRTINLLQQQSANRDITVGGMLEMLLGNQSSSSERLTDVPTTATITRTLSASSSSSSSSSLTNQTSSSISSLSRDGPFSSVGSTQNRIAEVNDGPPITKSKGTHDKHENKDLEQQPDNEASNEESKKKVECKICLDKEVGMIFMPCGHICACVTCSEKLQRCPVCRTYIKKKIRGYLS